MIRITFLVSSIISLIIVCGCSQPNPIDASEEDATIIHGLETKLIEALSDKDINQFASLYADNAMIFYPNTPPIIGKDALKQVWEEMFADPSFRITLQAERSEVSLGGDLAFAHGKFALSSNDENGTAIEEKGNYVVIFKKQSDGQWKIIIDIATPDHPVAANSGNQATNIDPRFSPDGKWIAFDSDESEIHIYPLQ